VLDSMFFKHEALFHLSGYINSQHSRIWCAENSHAVYKLVHICQKFVLGAQCLENELPYILESNPHPNLIHTSFYRFK